MKRLGAIVRSCGSLWFAAVLLMLLMVAMACATVFESTHGTERALAVFYHSRWFELLLGLLAVNVLAAVVVRYPFSRRQVGFVVTHASVLVVLGGALVTKHLGVDGQLGLVEGETASEFYDAAVSSLAASNREAGTQASVDLRRPVFGGFRTVDDPRAPVLRLGELRIRVQRYLPDGVVTEEVLDDQAYANPAVEVSISASGKEHKFWVFEGRAGSLGPLEVAYRLVSDEQELQGLAAGPGAAGTSSKGVARIEYEGVTYEIPVGETPGPVVPLGATGYTARVLRYLPHATVGPNNKVVNASDRPVNPAIEVAVVGPEGSGTHLAFAKFPDFGSMHGREGGEALRVRFEAATGEAPTAPIEVVSSPEGEMQVRFDREGGEVVTRRLELGEAVDSPWPGLRFAVLRRFERARLEQTVKAPEVIRRERRPAVLLELTAGQDSGELWVQKYGRQEVSLGDQEYEVSYGNKAHALGFALTLNHFRIGYYPGEERPRSYESHIDLADAMTGRTQSRVISMNHPVKHGGYSLYQSSYRQDGGRAVSFLSVSRDPGKPVVFAGYVGVMVGMVMVLGTRIGERRRKSRAAVSTAGSPVVVGAETA